MTGKITLKTQLCQNNEDRVLIQRDLKGIPPNPSKQYRSRIRSYGDILSVIKEKGRDGLIISNISRKANLSHYAVLSKCNQLISAGLIEEKTLDQKKIYIITGKGLNFFGEYENFKNLVENLNLKY